MTTIDLNHEVICVNPTDDLTLYDKNHIMSRIEKFLFAICSLDSSDLPVPLSRIEELYNCLVTGDTPPAFEPSSRAEKFLMACLGVYDINKLPEPLSRSEVLLKKLATGDSNLDDVDNLQSKYEFLLTYIIQNGGIDSDISYMKYTLMEKETTLYNTKERLVKSAILKGNTLVNRLGLRTSTTNATNVQHGLLNLTRLTLPIAVGESTIFFFECDFPNPSTDGFIELFTHKNGQPSWIGAQQFLTRQNGKNSIIIKNTLDKQIDYVDIYISNATQGTHILDNMMIITRQEGMENWDIPYFKGMASVKMPVLTTTGKNLLNEQDFKAGDWIVPVYENGKLTFAPTDSTRSSAYFRVNLEKGKQYVLSFHNITGNADGIAKDINMHTLSDTNTTLCTIKNKTPFTWDYETGSYYIRPYSYYTTANTISLNIQLEENSVVTTYEPFKSNILTSGKTFTQSMFEQGSFAESTVPDTESYENIKIDSSDGRFHKTRIRTKTTHKVISGASYNVKINDGYGIFICFCKNGLYSKVLTGSWSTFYNFTFTIPTDCDEIFFALRKIDNSDITVEDYPAIGLEFYQEVTLHGIGKMEDELNLLTGELTQRIGEVMLDGSESWVKQHYTTGYTMFRYIVPNLPTNTSIRIGCMLCDKFNVENYISAQAQTREFITIRSGTTGQLLLNVSDEKANEVTMLKEWLSQNPITVQYQLAENNIKTVDLSVVNQDGNDTKLSTFNDITYVTLSSGVLIPEAELEVATKNDEVLNTLSLEMDDISEAQTTLEETSNTQNENVDATMIATTEIYEGLL